MHEEHRGLLDHAGKPQSRAPRPLPKTFELVASPGEQVDVNPSQAWDERRFVELAVVVDPASDVRSVHPRKIIESLIGSSLQTPSPNRATNCLECVFQPK